MPNAFLGRIRGGFVTTKNLRDSCVLPSFWSFLNLDNNSSFNISGGFLSARISS